MKNGGRDVLVNGRKEQAADADAVSWAEPATAAAALCVSVQMAASQSVSPHAAWLAGSSRKTGRRLVKQKGNQGQRETRGTPTPLVATITWAAVGSTRCGHGWWCLMDGPSSSRQIGRCRDERAGGKMRAA